LFVHIWTTADAVDHEHQQDPEQTAHHAAQMQSIEGHDAQQGVAFRQRAFAVGSQARNGDEGSGFQYLNRNSQTGTSGSMSIATWLNPKTMRLK
jgi:hypothetical protein